VRSTLRLLALVSCIAAITAAAAVAAPRAPAPYKNPTVGRAVALQIPGMHLAKVKRNVVYRRSAEGPLKMDVYAPRASKTARPLPAVVFVHGITTAPSPKDLDQFVGWGQLAAASGVIGVTFSHRRGWAAPDTKAAIAYLRTNARKLGVDPERVALQAFSWDAPDAVGAALAGSPEYLRCIVVYYGILYSSNPQLSPEAYLENDPETIPPMLLVKAGSDVRDITSAMDNFLRLARQQGAPVQLVTYPQGRHSFDTLQHTEGSRRVMRTTLTFLRSCLRP
jgi:acetyl esterase/lipase